MSAETQSTPQAAVPGADHGRVWHGPEPSALHRLLVSACCATEDEALAAWQRWLRECHFDDEDPASFELASLAVGRLGALAGDGSEATRCRGWSRRAWFLSGTAMEAAERLDEASGRLGLRLVPVGDLATFRAGLRFAGRPFPVRSIEIHVPDARTAGLRELHAAAMQGSAGEAIRTRRLGLIIRSSAPPGDTPSPASRIAWLSARNWCRFPPGRLRWMLEIRAELESATAGPDPSQQLLSESLRTGRLAAVAEALRWIHDSGIAGDRLGSTIAALAAQPIPLSSRLRLWHARHQLGLGLRSRLSRRLHPRA